jgi:hypothetical protein
MKRTAFACSLLLVVAIAVVAAAPDGPGTRTVSRDIWGVQSGGFTFEGPDAGPWITIGAATGTLSQFGLVKLYTRHSANSDDGTLTNGEFQIVAENGNKIWGSYEGHAAYSGDYSEVYGTAALVISGGTGRFAHAHGTINATFVEKPINGNWYVPVPVTWALQGTVNY